MKPRLAAFALLSVAFILLSALVAAGRFDNADRVLFNAFAGIFRESVLPVVRLVAVLGGIDTTGLILVGLGVFLWRRDFRDELWALAGFPLIMILEVLYKRLVVHPGPTHSHPDGPSLSEILPLGSVAQNSYPSGHMARALFVYGLLAFVIHRLGSGRARPLAVVAALLVIGGVAFSRLYLAVHWESDVLGGMLLGGIWLLGATIWLDRPRSEGG